MAFSSPFFPSVFTLLLVFSLQISTDSKPTIDGCFGSIVSFGDSLTDTGNYLHSQNGKSHNEGRFPYGETYFHRPTGRFSDGRIILDFIAETMGLPLVPPYLGGGSNGADFRQGVNFAVGGATALESEFFRERGIEVDTNYSMGVQLKMFRQLLPSLCDSSTDFSDCNEFMRKSLFLVGEIGGNDYHIPLMKKRKLEEIVSFVPSVINVISSAIDDLIELGAKTLIVPGYLPVGCISGILAALESSSKVGDYDPQTGCIKWVNEFAEYHNEKLKQELDQSRLRHPSATIVYADYYSATMRIFRNPHHFGFGDDYLSACCRGGGPYNYNMSATCGTKGATVCSDPSKFIIWDGMHFTEAAYRAIAGALIHGPHAILHKHTCHVATCN